MKDICWKLHLRSSPKKVFTFLSTDKGRAQFWVESAIEKRGSIHFKFINGQEYKGKILGTQPPSQFEVDYFNTNVEFQLAPDGDGGTDLTLRNYRVPAQEYEEVHAGWLSVLLALKAAVDFGVDLRNHDETRTWDQGYVDN